MRDPPGGLGRQPPARPANGVISDSGAEKPANWKAEEPEGTALQDVATYVSEYASKDWDVRMRKTPTVLSYAEPGLKPRDLMLGVRAFGSSRAFPYDAVLKDKLVQDRVGAEPVILVAGPDGESVRAFRRGRQSVCATPERASTA